MKFGFIFPAYGQYCDSDLAAKAAIEAETAGFDSFLVWDHYMLPWGNETFDAWLLLSYLASLTKTIKLGTCVTPLPFRSPSQLAKIVATLDHLSKGRVILGVGAGWHKPEFDGYSLWEDDATRVSMVQESLELMTKLWTEDEVTHEGRFYSVKDAVLLPKPIQKPRPTIWFGAQGSRMTRMMVKYGDGWIPVGLSPRDFHSGVQRAKAIATDNQLDREFVFAHDANIQENERKYSESIEEFKDSGCNYYAVAWEYPREEFINRVKWFGETIIPSFS